MNVKTNNNKFINNNLKNNLNNINQNYSFVNNININKNNFDNTIRKFFYDLNFNNNKNELDFFKNWNNANEIKICKNTSLEIFPNLTGRNKVFNMNNKLNKQYNNKIDLKILVWNARSLNVSNDIKIPKLMALNNLTIKLQPDIIYINDTNNTNAVFTISYKKYFDGRNTLLVRNEIEEKVIIKNNYMIEMPDLHLCFVYFPPNLKTEDWNNLIPLIEKYLDDKFTLIGDMNLFSNYKLVDILNNKNILKNINGEPSLQVVITNKPKHLKLYPAPSDHLFLYVIIEKNVKFNSFLKLTSLKSKGNGYEIVSKLLKGKEPNIKSTIRIKRSNIIVNEQSQVLNFITNMYLNNNSGPLYKRFRYLWTKYKREPFLGTKIPNNVLESWKIHLKNDNNKKVKLVDENIKLVSQENIDNLITSINTDKNKMISDKIIKSALKLKISYSKAINYDLTGLNEIGQNLIKFIYNSAFKISTDENNKIIKYEQDLDKLISTINDFGKNIAKINNERDINHQDIAKTFFLKKNENINNYSDTRMIVISGSLIKLTEMLIYNEIQDFLSTYLNEKCFYQFGGIKLGSTYDAMTYLRYKCKKYNAKGVILSDISEGYDSINFTILENFIKNDKKLPERMKNLIIFWSNLVYNLNYEINGEKIYRTKGVPMGLMLSPIIFCYYVHKCVEEYEYLEDLIMYIDDVALLIRDDESDIEASKKLHKLQELLKRGELKLKLKKTHIISNGKNINIDNLKVEKKSKFLGVDIIIHKNYLERNYDNFIQMDEEKIKSAPKWLSLGMKRILFLGAIVAKQRFQNYMIPLKNDLMVEHIKKTRLYFASSCEKLSFVQIAFIICNGFREMIDSIFLADLKDKLIKKYNINQKKIDELINKRNPIIIHNKKINIFKDDKDEPNDIGPYKMWLTKEDKLLGNDLIDDNIMTEINKSKNIIWKKLLDKFKIKLYKNNDINLWNLALNNCLNHIIDFKIQKGFFFLHPMELWNINKTLINFIWVNFKKELLVQWIKKHNKEYKSNSDNVFKINAKILAEFMFSSTLANKYAILLDLTFGHLDWSFSVTPNVIKYTILEILFTSVKIVYIKLNDLKEKKEKNVKFDEYEDTNSSTDNNNNWLGNTSTIKWICTDTRKEIEIKDDRKDNKKNIFKVFRKLSKENIENETKILMQRLIDIENWKNNEDKKRGEYRFSKWWGNIRFALLSLDMLWKKNILGEDNTMDGVFHELWMNFNLLKENKEIINFCEDYDDELEKDEENKYIQEKFFDQFIDLE